MMARQFWIFLCNIVESFVDVETLVIGKKDLLLLVGRLETLKIVYEEQAVGDQQEFISFNPAGKELPKKLMLKF